MRTMRRSAPRAKSLPLNHFRASFSSLANRPSIENPHSRNGPRSAFVCPVTVSTSHPSLLPVSAPPPGWGEPAGPGKSDSPVAGGGGFFKEPVRVAALPDAFVGVPHFSETLKDLVQEKQEPESQHPQDAAASLLQLALIVPGTKEVVPPKTLGGFSPTPTPTTSGQRPDRKTELSAAPNPDGVAAPSIGVPRNAVSLHLVPRSTVPLNVTPPKVAPLPGERSVPKPVVRSAVLTAIAHTGVPAASDTHTSAPEVASLRGETLVPKPAVPSAVLTRIAHTGDPAASDTRASTDTKIPASKVAVKVPSSLAEHGQLAEPTKPAVSTAAPPAVPAPAVPAEAPVAQALLHEQTLGTAAVSEKPVEEMARSREDRNRPSKQAIARAWIRPQLDSGAPADTTPKAVFEPQPSGDSAQALKPIAAPTGAGAHPAPSQTAALEPTSTASAASPASDPENPQTPPTMKPATPAAASAEAAILAFAARLAALVAPPAAPVQPASATAAFHPAQSPEAPPSAKAISATDTNPAPEPVRSAPVNHGVEFPPGPKGAEPEKTRTVQDSVSVSAAVHSGPPPSPDITSQAIPTVTAPPDSPPQPPRMTGHAVPQGVQTEIESPPEPAKLVAPAREIQVQVNRGEQRVDVRLTERNGDIQVAVRTPDSQLAGSLREDLPLLSSRLEQAGFRAETWHPGASAPESRLRGVETQSSNSPSQDSDPSRQGGQEQPQPQPRQPKPPAAKAPNSPRKEFEWLMSQVS
jgi:hypothetical protein